MYDLRTQVEHAIELENRGDIDALAALYAANAIYIDSTGTEHSGRPAIAAFYRLSRAAFPDMKITLQRVIADGEWVAFQGSWTGRNSGPLRLGTTAMPATGRPVCAGFIGIGNFDTQSGLAVRMQVMLVDRLDFLKQLGMLPTPLLVGGAILGRVRNSLATAIQHVRGAPTSERSR